jgi:hypothetical protein
MPIEPVRLLMLKFEDKLTEHWGAILYPYMEWPFLRLRERIILPQWAENLRYDRRF